MKIYDADGADIPFRQFTFPDGQRHLELLVDGPLKDSEPCTVETRIANADELFDVLLAKNALDAAGYWPALDIRYLLGARMDRRINNRSPFTLRIVQSVLRDAAYTGAGGWRTVRILDPHSAEASRWHPSPHLVEAVYPTALVHQILADHYDPTNTVIVAPDAGATPRVQRLLEGLSQPWRVIQGLKHRDPVSGNLSGFSVEYPPATGATVSNGLAGQRCLILDDICDGGGTFSGLAAVLRQHGASRVDLFVTHGIFSKGLPLAGIDTVYTTDAYWIQGPETHAFRNLQVFPISMRDLP